MKQLLEDPSKNHLAIKKLKQGDDDIFLKVYKTYRNQFISWGKRNTALNEQDIEDGFQDAVIVLFKKLDVIDQSKSIVAFLWKTFKYKLYHKFREHVKFKWEEDVSQVSPEAWDDKIYQKVNNDHLKQLFKDALRLLGDPCETLLKLLIYKRFAPDAVATEMGYKNANVVYSKTHLCIQKLKEITANKI